jgi:hypothetical protein
LKDASTKTTFEMKSSSDEVSDSKNRNIAGDLGFGEANINIQEASQDEDTAILDLAVEPSSQQDEQPQRAETGSEVEDQPNLCMQLPSVKTENDEYVIYLGDYETGDTVVWSASDCLRAFHQTECILPFQAKAKACPRHSFIGPHTKREALVGAGNASCRSLEEVDTEEMATKSQQQQDTKKDALVAGVESCHSSLEEFDTAEMATESQQQQDTKNDALVGGVEPCHSLEEFDTAEVATKSQQQQDTKNDALVGGVESCHSLEEDTTAEVATKSQQRQ